MSCAVSCDRVDEEMARLLDGSAPAELLEHIASCDACRDARYDAERAAALVLDAGSDFELPSDSAERLDAPTTERLPPVEAPRAAPPPAISSRAPAPPGATGKARALGLAKRWAIPALAAAAAAALLASRGKPAGTSADDFELSGPPWRGKVEKVLSQGGRLEVCAPSGNACQDARQGDEVPAGSQLRTDRTTLAEISFTDGSRLSFDRDTFVRLSTRGRGGELVKGGIVADIEHRPNLGARFELKSGHVDVLGTKFSLRSDEDAVAVHVARGQVRLADKNGHSTLVLAGEEGRLYDGSPPVASPGAGLGEALGWSESVQSDDTHEPEARPRALGELKAKRPGEQDERSGAVRLDSHVVRVKIAGSVARTEVEEVFTNQTDDVLEGIFRFPLPPDAKIERLALESDGKLEEGAFVDRDRAAAIWRGAIVNAAPQLRQQIKDDIVWVPGPWRDPALLEWQRGGRFELRVYPIPKRGSRRVVLAYSQLVKQAASVRHYSYPLGFDPSGNASPLDFSIEVQLRGHDPAFRVRTPGWDVNQSQSDGRAELRFSSRSFVPTGDFRVDYALAEGASELSAWGYRDPKPEAGAPYVALTLRPELPRRKGVGPGRAIALVVDASRSVFGENYRRATSLAARLARDLDAKDRVTVLACDSTCRELPGELRAPGVQTAQDVRRFLEHVSPEGASDVTLGIARGFGLVRHEQREPIVVYIGDGTATAGPTRAATIERAVRAATPRGGRVAAIGIGPESDSESLLALARGGGGAALPYVPGQPLGDAVLAAISTLYGAALSDVSLELPPGISQVSPARLDPIIAGSEVLVAGRLSRPEVKGSVVLKGTLDGRPFEQRYALDVAASESSGNAFVPRLYAAARIVDLERDGSASAKGEAVELSIEHGVASRYTSLLVLESEAMYRAFGLERSRKTAEYTADLEAEGSSADGELALADDEAEDKSAAGGPVSVTRRMATGAGGGRGANAASSSGDAAERRPAAAPKKARIPAGPAASPELRSESYDLLGERARREPTQPAPMASDPLDPLAVLAPRPRPAPPMIPMRRIWERKGEIFTDRFVPKQASGSALTEAERELQRDDSRRASLKKAFALSSAAGDLSQAARLAERWLEKEPMDPEALTALADVEARRGRRDSAIRLLGSVLDVRPGDTAAHKRLARLERWAGRADLACRHAIAIAENKASELLLVSDAVRCARNGAMPEIAEALLSSASNRAAVEQLAAQSAADPSLLSGDVRLEASWSGGPDLDLSLLDVEGHRISWLGAATRSVISARDTLSESRESLALRGAAPGEYVVELTRGAGAGAAQGELTISVAGSTRRVPFSFDGDRKAIGLLRLSMQPRLVPL